MHVREPQLCLPPPPHPAAVYLHDCDDVLLQLGLQPELFLGTMAPLEGPLWHRCSLLVGFMCFISRETPFHPSI